MLRDNCLKCWPNNAFRLFISVFKQMKMLSLLKFPYEKVLANISCSGEDPVLHGPDPDPDPDPGLRKNRIRIRPSDRVGRKKTHPKKPTQKTPKKPT